MLLEPVFARGERVRAAAPLERARARVRSDLAALPEGATRLANPHAYPVGLERGLYERKTALVLAARGVEGDGGV